MARAATQGLVVVSPHGAVQFATERAARWLRQFFGLSGTLKRLPAAVTRWLSESKTQRQARPFVASYRGTRLRIDLLHSEATSFCLLIEKTSTHRPNSPPRGRPLTKREAEVLTWVAHGKSNAEIATILEVRTKTVDKHLERIYPKLGVENRTAAASHLHSIMGN